MRWGMAEDYYNILGVTKDATSQEIKRAFREIARKCHPDLAGADPAAEEQFKNARKAYETLMDPVARARYDRRGQRVQTGGGSFFDAFYKATERSQAARSQAGRTSAGAPKSTATGRKNPGNSVTLDDLFNDFGDFGFGEGKAGKRPPPDNGAARYAPAPGDDVHIDLDVPADIASSGGSLTAIYYRMQRADSWRPGAPDPGLLRVQDIADIRIMPGATSGELLRERGLGDAGQHGGAYGDLVVRLKIVRPRPSAQRTQSPPEGHTHTGAPTDTSERQATEERSNGAASADPSPMTPCVDLTIVEAMLGGRVSLDTPQGKVRLTIPPGTSSGMQLRIKGRGPLDAAGQPTDYYVWTRIVVPKVLDAASRGLIEEYARLNPSSSEE